MSLPSSPFKGLASFGDSEHDRLFFFGRERESELVTANLMAARLTVLYGPSGVGKSSLLRASVARRLRSRADQCQRVGHSISSYRTPVLTWRRQSPLATGKPSRRPAATTAPARPSPAGIATSS